MHRSTRITLLVLTVLQGTLTGVVSYAELFPPSWRPVVLLAGILGSSLTGALAARRGRRRRQRGVKLVPARTFPAGRGRQSKGHR